MNHRSASRSATQRSPGPVGRSEAAGCSMGKPEFIRGSQHSFLEDFNLEHSLSGVTITLFAISASADPAQSGLQRSTEARELISPSCVYLG